MDWETQRSKDVSSPHFINRFKYNSYQNPSKKFFAGIDNLTL